MDPPRGALLALDSEVIYRLRQQIIDSWHDHDGGTPVEAARHYGEEARLIPAFDNSGAIEGQESIHAWFEFQRQKFGPESRWDFQHRVTGFHFQLSGDIVHCRQRLRCGPRMHSSRPECILHISANHEPDR